MIRPLRRLFLFAALILLLLPPAARIPLGFLPGEGSPVVSVTVELKGSFAETVEATITLPLEEELYELPGLKSISSVSQAAESRVLLVFDERTAPETAYLAVRDAVDRSSVRFPGNAQRPRIDQSDPSARPLFVVAMPPTEEEELRRRFEQIEGVGTVFVGGGARRELLLAPDRPRLATTGRSIPDLVGRLQSDGVVGSFHRKNEAPLFLDTRPRRVREFGGLLLAPGVPLSGLAHLTVSSTEGESVSRINGRATSVVTVTAAGGANDVALCRRLRHLTASIPGAEILYDYGRRVEDALSEAAIALGIGAAAVALATLLFVRRPGSAAAVAGTIPFCALVSVAILSVLGMELDVMSLAGIAVGVGLVVDAGIIYLEFSSQKARSPVLLGGITTVVVFVPLIFAPPSLSTRFAGLAVAIVASVGASMLYVFGLLPALPGDRNRAPGRGSPARETTLPSWFVCAFRQIGGARRWTVIPICLGALAAPLLLVSLPRDARTALEDGLLRVTLEYPAATTSRAVEADARRLEEELVIHSAVRRVTATFEDERARFEIVCGECRRVRRYLEGEAEKGYLSGFLFFPDDTPDEARVLVIITAENPVDARDAAQEVARAAEALLTARGVLFHFKESPDAAVVRVDVAAARLSGVSPRLPASALYWSSAGPVAAKWRPPGDEIDIRIPKSGRSGNELLAELLVAGERATSLGTMASLSLEPSIGRLDRYNRRAGARLSVLTGRQEAQETATALQKSLGGLTLPRGTTVVVNPEAGDRETERRSLLLMGMLSLFLVLAVVLAAFESLPAVRFCLLQLPLSWLAPAAYLSLTGSSLSPAVALGLVVTTGVAVNNTILVYESARVTGPIRALWSSLRPIATASATTIVGVVPLVFVGSASILGQVAVVLSAGSLGSFAALLATFPGAGPGSGLSAGNG